MIVRSRVLWMNLVLISLLMSSCATLSNLFQTDPVGTTLFAMKTSYEGAVKSVGQAYITGQIDDAQLKQFVTEANKFYVSYNTVLGLHQANKLDDPNGRIDALQKSLDQLQAMVTQMVLKKKAAVDAQESIEMLPFVYAVRI